MKISTLCAAATIVAAAALASAPATAKTVITHEALWMMKRVGAPAVSPDGKWVVYSITEPSYEPDKAVSDLWLAPAAVGAAPRRLTHTKAGEGGAVWSPDSRSIAFTTKREGDEVDQVYVLDIAAGGEARRVTSLSTAAADPKWRPDGQAILFETMVYPNALDDEANRKAAAAKKARKYNVRTYEHYPIRYWNEWLDERQPTLEVQSLEPGSKAKDILSPTKLAHTPGFSGPEGETSISLSPVWSPDGKEVVFAATVERWNAAFSQVGYQLYRLPAEGGEATPVTSAKGSYRAPAFSPDGKTLYFIYEPHNAEIYNLARLSKVAWPAGGEATVVARDFDREPEHFAVTPDGKAIYFLSPEAGKTNLYRVAPEGGKPALVIEPATGGYGNLVIPQKAAKPELIATYGSSVSPQEIVRIDPAAKTHANLTDVDTALAATIDWAPPQHFWFTSAGGRKIHNMIILPPNFDPAKKYPLLVFIHGGAASMNPDAISLRWNYHLLTAAGYVMLMTDYTGSTGFGEKFAQQIKLDPLKTPGLAIRR
jgi:dipeptidyl aminopeptidase/acylaminoacyl peptidase